MKSVASRQFAARPAEVWRDLEKEGAIVVTKDGHPRGIVVPTSDSTLLEDIQSLVFARARRATSAMRSDAAANATDHLTMDEIDAEIRAARAARRD